MGGFLDVMSNENSVILFPDACSGIEFRPSMVSSAVTYVCQDSPKVASVLNNIASHYDEDEIGPGKFHSKPGPAGLQGLLVR